MSIVELMSVGWRVKGHQNPFKWRIWFGWEEELQPQESLSIIRLTFLCRSPESPVEEDARQEENAPICQLHGIKK